MIMACQRRLRESIAMDPFYCDQEGFTFFGVMIQPFLSLISRLSGEEWLVNTEYVNELLGYSESLRRTLSGILYSSSFYYRVFGSMTAESILVCDTGKDGVSNRFRGEFRRSSGEIWLVLSGTMNYKDGRETKSIEAGNFHFIPPECIFEMYPEDETTAVLIRPIMGNNDHPQSGDASVASRASFSFPLSEIMRVNEGCFRVPRFFEDMNWTEGSDGILRAPYSGYSLEDPHSPRFIRTSSDWTLGDDPLREKAKYPHSYVAYIVLGSPLGLTVVQDQRPSFHKLQPGTLLYTLANIENVKLEFMTNALLLEVPMFK